VGQDEVDIIGIADTTCLVLVPGLGDAIQSMKAGIMEIADIFTINKADRAGADQLQAEVTYRVEQDASIKPTDWSPLVVRTTAVTNEGVDELWQAIQQHRKHLENTDKLLEKRRERTYRETLRMIHNELFRVVREQLQSSGQLDHLVEDILDHKNDPYTIMRQIVKKWLSISKK
jgi:LAO/AO transport system kinase